MKPWAGVVAIAALAATALAGVSCGGTTTGPSASCAKTYKVGLVTDVGKLSDKSFNFDSYNGVLDAAADSSLCVTGKAIESSVEADYPKNIQTFLDAGYDMIVTVGFKLGDATIKAANSPCAPAAGPARCGWCTAPRSICSRRALSARWRYRRVLHCNAQRWCCAP